MLWTGGGLILAATDFFIHIVWKILESGLQKLIAKYLMMEYIETVYITMDFEFGELIWMLICLIWKLYPAVALNIV